MTIQIAAIARNTFTELVRQKIFYIILVFALCAIGSSLFMARLTFQEEFQMLKDVCLGAMSIFTSLLAILATANFLPKDLEERTIYNLLSKPVPRFVYLLGKLAGIILLLLLFTLLMSAVFCLVLWLREQGVLAETRVQFAGATLRGADGCAEGDHRRNLQHQPGAWDPHDFRKVRRARIAHAPDFHVRNLLALHGHDRCRDLLHRPFAIHGARILAAGRGNQMVDAHLASASSPFFFPTFNPSISRMT